MNLAYAVYSNPSFGHLGGLLVNFCLFALIAFIVWLIVSKIAASAGIDSGIVQIIGLILLLIVVLALFGGCTSYPLNQPDSPDHIL